ncbi:hypothetical protein RHSIM_Rhsim11G0008600 [Rhododendron simsii]|uniref:Uncharacterized protein n=1 Tax=Rhododendron simsii TaxID=118357 RepID=A0A834G5U9_RHOSS|nr:hypothetical protein RHSIM_Rhsim11G0008600 [Rhododendron simsii]
MVGRSKQLRSGVGSSEPQPDFNTQLFTNRVNEGNWAGFKSRPIISGRQVSISPRYHRYINDVITAAGWSEIMTVSNIIYPKLVRYFYCNLDVDRNADECTPVSRVKGVDFVRDVSTMSSFLQCQVVKRNQYVANDEELVNTMDDGSAFYQTITDDRGEHLAQPQIGGDFTTQIFARFDALQASQNQMLAEFQNFAIAQNSWFDRVEHQMDHIDQAQQHYFSHFYRQYPDFVPYPPYHPPSPPQ